MKQGRLGKTEFWGNIAGETKIWILINGARDETHYLLLLLFFRAKYVRERGGEGRGCLHRREHDLADVVRHAVDYTLLVSLGMTRVVLFPGGDETECGTSSGSAGALLYLEDVWIHGADVIQVTENESLVDVKSNGYDVLGIFEGKPMALLQF